MPINIPLTEEEVDKIMSSPKQISADLVWKYDQNNEVSAKAEVVVDNELGLDLRVVATVNLKQQDHFSIALLVNKANRIRGYCATVRHKNKHTDRNSLAGDHEHIWTNRCHDGWVRTASGGSAKDITSAFDAFCKVWNIDFSGSVSNLPALQAGF